MSVLTNIPLNLMSQPTPAKEEDTKQSTLKKIDAGAKSTLPESGPERRKAAQRYFPPPFSRAVYQQFLTSLKNGKNYYPSSKQLRAISFAIDDTHILPRKRFRQLLTRLSISTVEGDLVFGANTTQDVLISKRTRKIIVAAEDAEMIVKRAHVSGSNSGEFTDQTKQKHKSYSDTVEVLQTHFSVHRRDFGIDRTVMKRVISNCQSCALAELSSDDEYDVPGRNGFLSACHGSKPSRQKRSVPSICRPRFSSMIAHVTDRQCIWYDRKSIEKSSNKYQKFLSILLEMKGDMALAVNGRVGARHRLETKLYCCQLLIKDYLKTMQQSLQTVASEDTSIQLQSLQQEYQEANQSSMFHLDLQNVLISVKNNKLVLPPLLGTQIEEYLNESSDTLKS